MTVLACIPIRPHPAKMLTAFILFQPNVLILIDAIFAFDVTKVINIMYTDSFASVSKKGAAF